MAAGDDRSFNPRLPAGIIRDGEGGRLRVEEVSRPQRAAGVGRELGFARCVQCGRAPTAKVSFVCWDGLVAATPKVERSGPFCRDCGVSVARELQSRQLVRGLVQLNRWRMVKALVANRRALRRVRAVGAPKALSGQQLGASLPPGRPLWLRAGAAAAVVHLLLVAGVLFAVRALWSDGGDTSPAAPAGQIAD